MTDRRKKHNKPGIAKIKKGEKRGIFIDVTYIFDIRTVT